MHLMSSGDASHDEWARRHAPPENEVPVAVPVDRVLARTATAAVVLGGLQVWTTGIGFTVALRCRPEALGAAGSTDLGELFWGHGGSDSQLLVGVELADGRRASNLSGGPDPFGVEEAEDLVLSQTGGEGGQLSVVHGWWVSPLPPDGPLRVVVRCDLLGIPETVTELDGTAVRAAAGGVVTLWPWVSPHEAEPPQPPPGPDLPADSWFARG